MDFDEIDDAVLLKLCDNIETEYQESPNQPSEEHQEVLSRCFGHKNFRPMQWEIISSIINDRKDVCAVMATGYGKSLCYQYPSTYMGGVTLVISPLISLMEDQIISLTMSNIPAVLLGSAQKSSAMAYEDIFNNAYSLIYATPEYCCCAGGQEVMKKMARELQITLIAVDEAHCISSWGHDFRKEFRQLNVLRKIFPDTPLMAVTATATQLIRDDISKCLNLRDPLKVCSSFDRPNLYFEINGKGISFESDIRKVMVRKDGQWRFSGPTIVYCIKRQETEDISGMLQSMGIKSLPYHAGLSLTVRKHNHEQFVKDKVDVIVGTIAFGMGIDKPDVRNVVHYGAAKSVENYYQEVGRAGRDGLPAKCVTFYTRYDFEIYRSMAENEARTSTNIENIKDFFFSNSCRRLFLLKYFGEATDSNTSTNKHSCCDNCRKRRADSRDDNEKYEGLDDQGRFDFSEDARKFLYAVTAMNGSYGLGTYVMFLRGSKSAKLDRFKNDPQLGCGKNMPEAWWKGVGEILIKECYLSETRQRFQKNSRFSFSQVSVSALGKRFLLDTSAKLLVKPTLLLTPFLKVKPAKDSGWLTKPTSEPSTSKRVVVEEAAEVEQRMTLYRKLLSVRTLVASQLDCMPYSVASNTALMQMAKFKPQTLEDIKLLNCDGMNDVKIMKFGGKFLKIINSGYKEPEETRSPEEDTIKDILLNHPIPGVSVNLTMETTCRMFIYSKSIEDVCQKRGLVNSTIEGHLVNGMKMGLPIKLSTFEVTPEILNKILVTFKTFYNDFRNVSVSKLKMECPPEFTYSQIKACIAYLQVRRHLAELKIPYKDFEEFPFKEPEVPNCTITESDQAEIEEFVATLLEYDEDFDNFQPPAKKEKLSEPIGSSGGSVDSALNGSVNSQTTTSTEQSQILKDSGVELTPNGVTDSSKQTNNQGKQVLPPLLERELPTNEKQDTSKQTKVQRKKVLPPWLQSKVIH